MRHVIMMINAVFLVMLIAGCSSYGSARRAAVDQPPPVAQNADDLDHSNTYDESDDTANG